MFSLIVAYYLKQICINRYFIKIVSIQYDKSLVTLCCLENYNIFTQYFNNMKYFMLTILYITYL